MNQINASLDRSVMRSRLVSLDVAALPNPRVRPLMAREPSLSLELFPDVFIVAVFDRFDPNTSGVTWVGHVENVAGSSVTLSYSNRLMTGSIVMPGGAFHIRPAAEDVRAANRQATGEVHVIAQVDQAALPREAEPIVPTFSPEVIAAAATRDTAMADSASFIDVLVVYTAVAQAAQGGATGMTNLINLGVSETNTTYANSGVTQRVRLVGTSLVPYVETGAFSTNLNNLRFGLSGLNGVLALRDQLKADLVMMLVHPVGADACGIGFIMQTVNTSFESAGYSVTDTICVSPGLTMPHEWGHNMGANHDWFVSSSTLPYSYAHGYNNTKPGQRWRTVMSYNDACAVQGFNCTRLLAWANPDYRLNPLCTGGSFVCAANLWYLPGEPMGIPGGTKTTCTTGSLTNNDCDADDHRTLNNTALTVANLRQGGTSTTSGRR
ncbi:MAG TPA: M12 family metallo-peptidase [Vicinamibacterales bacterium]|nr:M12 family metallo-peptidase [Vicinamibacterales bacterium]